MSVLEVYTYKGYKAHFADVGLSLPHRQIINRLDA